MRESGECETKTGGHSVPWVAIALGIGISLAIAALFIPPSGMGMGEGNRKTADRNEIKNLTNAVLMFKMEYGKLPSSSERSADAVIVSKGEFVETLMGFDPAGLNPREKVFYVPNLARGADTDHPTGGVYADSDTGTQTVCDSFGNPFTIVLDTNYDDVVTDPRTGKELRKSIIVFSHGKDPNNVKDDLLSWQ